MEEKLATHENRNVKDVVWRMFVRQKYDLRLDFKQTEIFFNCL